MVKSKWLHVCYSITNQHNYVFVSHTYSNTNLNLFDHICHDDMCIYVILCPPMQKLMLSNYLVSQVKGIGCWTRWTFLSVPTRFYCLLSFCLLCRHVFIYDNHKNKYIRKDHLCNLIGSQFSFPFILMIR